MFGLPDYLYSVKESLKYKKTEENLQKRNQGFKYRYFNFKLEIPIQNSALYTSKSQIAANINSRSNMNNTDTKDFDEDEDNNEEEEIEENDLDNNKVLSKIEKDMKQWQKVKNYSKQMNVKILYIFLHKRINLEYYV